METRHRRRGAKSARAAASDPPVRPPSPVSESEEECEAELADIRATGVRDRDPPITTQPGDTYQTPPAGVRAGIAAPPSPASLAQGGLATPGAELRGPEVATVDTTNPHAQEAEAMAPLRPLIPAHANTGYRQWRYQALPGWNGLIPFHWK